MFKIVIAGNYKEYQRYLRVNNLNPNEARYVSLPEQLKGLRGEVVYTGQYWNNPCYGDYYLDYIREISKEEV
jgi:hypothetical protein